MKPGISFFLFLFVLQLLSGSCTSDNTYQNLPPCITNEISLVDKTEFNVKIYRCNLNGSIVYQVLYDQCCDWNNFIYDQGCNQVCVYGGWSGNPCDSLLNALTDKQLVFENP